MLSSIAHSHPTTAEPERRDLPKVTNSRVCTLNEHKKSFVPAEQALVSSLEGYKDRLRSQYSPIDPEKVALARGMLNDLCDQTLALASTIAWWNIRSTTAEDWRSAKKGMLAFVADEPAPVEATLEWAGGRWFNLISHGSLSKRLGKRMRIRSACDCYRLNSEKLRIIL